VISSYIERIYSDTAKKRSGFVFYNPCEGKKLYEAHPGDEYAHIREKVREALEYAL